MAGVVTGGRTVVQKGTIFFFTLQMSRLRHGERLSNLPRLHTQ